MTELGDAGEHRADRIPTTPRNVSPDAPITMEKDAYGGEQGHTGEELANSEDGDAPSALVGVANLSLSGPEKLSVVVPRLWLVNDERMPRLEWRAERVREVDRDPDWLPTFVKLVDAEPEDIEAFARLRGVLGVNYDGRAGFPKETNLLTPFDQFWEWEDRYQQIERHLALRSSGRVNDRFWEPINAWRAYARRFRAILRIALDVQEGREPSLTDRVDAEQEPLPFVPDVAWPLIPRLLPAPRPDPLSATGQLALETVVTKLLNELQLSVGVDLSGSAPGRLVLHMAPPEEEADREAPWTVFLAPATGLYPTLVVQLVAAITSPFGLVRCSWCDNPYARSPERAPRADRRRFCSDECRGNAKKEANREISRRRYERQKAGEGGTNPAGE